MTMPRVRAGRVLAWVMTALLALGVWQAVGAIAVPASWQRLRADLGWGAFLSGRTTRTLNHIMAFDLPADAALREAGGVLRWNLFGSAGAAVRPGCAGWLFLTEELRPWPTGDADLAARAAGVVRLAARLRGQGVRLVVAVSPDKAQVEAGRLCGAPYSAQSAGRLARFTALLAAGGVAAVDLLTPLRTGDTYLRSDSHWTPEGAGLAARAVAAAVGTAGLARTDGIRTTVGGAAPRAGDLLRLMSLERAPARLRPSSDVVAMAETVVPTAEGGLLDETAALEIVLLGSSFSLNGDFDGQLQQALGARVANFAKAGGGASGSAIGYFGSAASRESRPRVVIWEILGRGLTQPIDAAERTFLLGN